MKSAFPAPTGRNAKAQGDALGLGRKKQWQALYGRNKRMPFWPRTWAWNFTAWVSPLQGLALILRNIPKAMPWAFALRPVGAGKGQRPSGEMKIFDDSSGGTRMWR